MNAYDYIDEYVAGLLTGEQLRLFEQAMAADEKLAHLVDSYDDIKSVSEGVLELQLLEEIKSIQETTESAKKKANSDTRYWLIAAVFVLLSTLGWYIFSSANTSDKGEQMQFAELYKEPIWPTVRSSPTDKTDRYYQSKAASKFLDGDLLTAKQILLDSMEDKRMARYWLAEMYMAQQEFDSVLVYLPEFDGKHVKYHRSSYLSKLVTDLIDDRNKDEKVKTRNKKKLIDDQNDVGELQLGNDIKLTDTALASPTLDKAPAYKKIDVQKKESRPKPIASGQQLFAAAFSPYRHPSLQPTTRGQSDTTPRDQFESAYWEEKYGMAVSSWSSLSSKEKSNFSLQFLYANALMQTGEIKMAIPILRQLDKQSNKRFDAVVDWQLALGYLHEKDLKACQALLNKITNQPNHPYTEKAKNLLVQIK